MCGRNAIQKLQYGTRILTTFWTCWDLVLQKHKTTTRIFTTFGECHRPVISVTYGFATRLTKYWHFERAEIESDKDNKNTSRIFTTFGDCGGAFPQIPHRCPLKNDKDFHYFWVLNLRNVNISYGISMISQNYQKTTRIFTIFDSVTVTWIQRPVLRAARVSHFLHWSNGFLMQI